MSYGLNVEMHKQVRDLILFWIFLNKWLDTAGVVIEMAFMKIVFRLLIFYLKSEREVFVQSFVLELQFYLHLFIFLLSRYIEEGHNFAC